MFGVWTLLDTRCVQFSVTTVLVFSKFGRPIVENEIGAPEWSCGILRWTFQLTLICKQYLKHALKIFFFQFVWKNIPPPCPWVWPFSLGFGGKNRLAEGPPSVPSAHFFSFFFISISILPYFTWPSTLNLEATKAWFLLKNRGVHLVVSLRFYSVYGNRGPPWDLCETNTAAPFQVLAKKTGFCLAFIRITWVYLDLPMLPPSFPPCLNQWFVESQLGFWINGLLMQICFFCRENSFFWMWEAPIAPLCNKPEVTEVLKK